MIIFIFDFPVMSSAPVFPAPERKYIVTLEGCFNQTAHTYAEFTLLLNFLKGKIMKYRILLRISCNFLPQALNCLANSMVLFGFTSARGRFVEELK